MLKMGTRAASFSAKIRNLQEYHHRLLNNITPFPSSADIINVLKFFSQALLTILRDIPCLPIDLIRDVSRDPIRIGFFPNLDYRTLYYTLSQMLDSFPHIQSTLQASAPVVFEYLLHALVCLVPFLEHELMDSMPLTVANTISLNFISHQDIIDMLCYNILPFTLNPGKSDETFDFANASIPSILMTVLSHTDSLSLHSQLLECLMRLKANIIEDLLVVIGYGTGKARHAAVELLFQYWPGLNPSTLDRKTLSEKHIPWKPLTCQNETCQNTLNNEAVKICFAQIEGNPTVATTSANLSSNTDFKGRPPIPLLICIECAEMVREQSNMIKGQRQDVLLNVLHPMTEICYSCESKSCQSVATSGGAARPSYTMSSQSVAVVTCFSTECTSFNCNKPVRLCAQCHQARHRTAEVANPEVSSANQETISSVPVLKRHLVQEHLQSLWQLPMYAQQHFAEAVIALLREASVLEKSSKDNDRYVRTHGPGAYTGLGGVSGGGGGGGGGLGLGSSAMGTGGADPGGIGGTGAGGSGGGGGGGGGAGGSVNATTDTIDSTIEERQLLSRYGIWLLIGLCDPNEAITNERMELLGRMLAMLCQWFHNTACLPDDQAGSALERIKSESIHGWLMKVVKSQFRLFANCLIPNPPEYAQIGGHWETWPSMSIQIKEGFKRLLCLVPYDIITADIWAYIMPFWMESFRYDLAEAELSELKILLSKVLDPDLSPLGLAPKVMYHFISVCFEKPSPPDQEQALSWLQILTLLEIPVPINLLNTMFLSGIKSLISIREELQSQSIEKPYQETDLSEEINLIPGPSTLPTSASNSELPIPPTAQTLENLAESQLACYVLMLDILLKQFELQEIAAHKGLDTGRDVSNTIQLLFEMISVANCTNAIGGHRCSNERAHAATDSSQTMSKPDSILSECYFCDLCSIWYQLSLQLITYFAPLVEITVMHETLIPESVDANFYLSTLNIDKPTSGEESDSQQPRSTLYSINEDSSEHLDSASPSKKGDDETLPFESEPIDWRELKIDEEQLLQTIELNMTEKLTLKFLQELESHNDPDVLYYLLQCLKLLTLHAGILNRMSQDEKKKVFFHWCQRRYLVNNLWKLLQAEFSQISQISVPLLLHCISLPGGQIIFSRMINSEFKHSDWCVRFATIERVATLSQFIEQSVVKSSSFLQNALSNVFTHLIQALDDINCSVSQRALLSLESMRHASLKLYVYCLEIQFDLVIVDRCLVLSSLLQLFNHLNERRVLTWDFFLNRFDTLFLEAQVYLNKSNAESSGTLEISDHPPTRDLRNTNVHSETYKKKVKRAHEALAQTHVRRSLLRHHHRASFREPRLQSTKEVAPTTPSTVATPVAKANTVHKSHHHHKFGSRSENKFKAMSSSSTISRKSSKLAALTGSAFPNNFFHENSQSKRDLAQEELQLFTVVHRALDEMDFTDQETIHLLVFLFMQFLSWSDPQHPADEKSLNRTQIIVLRHLNTLLGYSMSENSFLLSAYDLRRKPIFSSFLSALPDVLDLNLPVGALLLPTAFPVLVYSPAPARFIYQSDVDSFTPNYSLWLLQPHLRVSWLNSLIVILYKHDYNSLNVSIKFVYHLIQIVMNTLESALEHRCAPGDVSARRRSKEFKEILNQDGETETKTDSLGGEDTITTATSSKAAKMIMAEVEATNAEVASDPEMTVMMMMMSEASTSSAPAKEIDLSDKVNQVPPVSVEKESTPLAKIFEPELVVAKILPEAIIKSEVKPMGEKLVSSDDSLSSAHKATQGETETEESNGQTPSSSTYQPLPTIERLLPIGGELSECVRHQLARRPFPSMIGTTDPKVSKNCCCCCASTSGPAVCCMNYQQTIDAFKQQQPRDLSRERLLPIGPRPVHSRAQTVTSRSVERSQRRPVLIRQHTTIGPGQAEVTESPVQLLNPSKSADSMNNADSNRPKLVTTKMKYEPEPKKYKVQSSPTSPPTSEEKKKRPVEKSEWKITVTTNKSPIVESKKEASDVVSFVPNVDEPKVKSKVVKSELTTGKDSTESISKPGKEKGKKNRKKSKKASKLSNGNSNGEVAPKTVVTPKSEPETFTPPTPPPPPPPPMAGMANIDSSKPANTNTGRSNESSHSDQSLNQFELCSHCRLPVEQFDEHELGLCLVSLATFVHRDTASAASVLPQILTLTARYALRCVYPWQMESNIHLPGNTASIARQFIRCTLHQLNSNGIFRQIFQTNFADVILFRSIAISLADFVELNQVTPLKQLFEALVEDKQLPSLSQLLHILTNVATYFECVFVDYNVIQSAANLNLASIPPLLSSSFGATAPVMGAGIVANQPWADLMASFEAYLRRLSICLSDMASTIHNLVPLMRVLLAMFKIPGIGAHRSILDPVNKLLVLVIQHSPLLLEHVRELCILCARAYVRDRDRLCIARTFSVELVQALRFRTQLPDENILLLVQWALEDAGGSLPYSIVAQSLERNQNKQMGQSGVTVELTSTNATECLRSHINDLLDFIGDVHALTRFKSNFQGTAVHLNEETIGGQLKAGIAQFLALELTRCGGSDHRAVTKYLPWLYSLPSLQQGPKEFLECISHVRLLSWILLGSLQHTALMKCHPSHSNCLVSQPIPLEASTHIAEHVQAILAGFAEQSKASVLHMSALFYAFLLCQLWTVYCEQLASQNPPGSDAAHQNILVLSDFWSKVTPGVLQLICHSKALSDTISLHFLSLMETLMECNSEILSRLIPLWLPLFNSYQGQLSGNIRVRLQNIVSWPCPPQTRDDAMMISTILIRWLQRIQAKMSQIEMQSSTAIQFYCI